MPVQTHILIGSAVLIVSLLVGIWLIVAARSSKTAGTPLTAALVVVVVLLALQILAGIDLASRGTTPAPGVLGVIHVVGPLIALVVGLWALLGVPRAKIGRYIMADHLTFLVALVSFIIGMAFAH